MERLDLSPEDIELLALLDEIQRCDPQSRQHINGIIAGYLRNIDPDSILAEKVIQRRAAELGVLSVKTH